MCFLGIALSGLFGYPFTEFYRTEHFKIYYNVDSVPSCKDISYIPYGSNPAQLPAFGDPDWEDDPKNPGKKRRTIPYYILDIGKNMEKALKVYVDMGLVSYDAPPQSNPAFTDETYVLPYIIEVYVQSLNSGGGTPIDGETSTKTGVISINQNVPVSPELPNKVEVLRKACAHELLHHVTFRNYSALNATVSGITFFVDDFAGTNIADKTSVQWWWECLATQADRLVFPDSKPYEAENYAMDPSGIITNLHNSWDVCNADPQWYISSGFLSYLLYYREGQKADFAQIFFYPIKNLSNTFSFVRESLDKYVKEKLGSKGLGYEYQNYMIWLMEKRNPYFHIIPGGDNRKYVQTVKLDKKNIETQSTYTIAVPYMALKVLKINQSPDVDDKTYTIKNRFNKEEDAEMSVTHAIDGTPTQARSCEVWVYECNNETRKLLKKLGHGDSLNISYEKGKWTEVAVTNPLLSANSNEVISIIRYPSLEGKYKGKVIFSGENPKLDAMYTITLSELDIEIKDTLATCNFEFHKAYARDGFYAKGTALKGKADPLGNVTIIGSVQAFTYPKGSPGCCDFPQVKEDPKCAKMNANPYFWKFTGKVSAEGGKYFLKGSIAAGLSAKKFMKASENLYKFETERE